MTNGSAVAQEESYVVVGQLGKPHALLGWIKVNSFTQPIDNLLDYKPWFYQKNNQWLPLPVDKAQLQGNSIVAHVQGYDNPETARALTGIEIAVTRSQLPPLENDEYFWCDLIGLEVVTLAGVKLGKVTRLFSSGASDILVIEGQKEHLIPYIKGHFVSSVDIASQTIVVDWDPEFY